MNILFNAATLYLLFGTEVLSLYFVYTLLGITRQLVSDRLLVAALFIIAELYFVCLQFYYILYVLLYDSTLLTKILGVTFLVYDYTQEPGILL